MPVLVEPAVRMPPKIVAASFALPFSTGTLPLPVPVLAFAAVPSASTFVLSAALIAPAAPVVASASDSCWPDNDKPLAIPSVTFGASVFTRPVV